MLPQLLPESLLRFKQIPERPAGPTLERHPSPGPLEHKLKARSHPFPACYINTHNFQYVCMVDLNDVVITCFPGFGTCVMAGNLMQTASTPAWKTVVVLLPESTKLPLDSPTKPINTTIQRHAMG